MLQIQSKTILSFCKIMSISLMILTSSNIYAHSLAGHKNDFYKVLEGVSGKNLEEIYKFISSGMDSENYKINPNSKKNGYSFVKEFREKFGSLPKGNHRLIGHWGFEGAIPFESEPYKSALAQYPKNEIVKLWQEFVNKVTDFVMKKTGLPKKQAKGLAGVIYNTHLLGDYTTTYTEPLPFPKHIADETSKSLNRLLGNNSKLAQKVKNEFSAVNKKCTRAEYANKIKEILYDNGVGEKFYQTHSQSLTQKRIIYNTTKNIIPKKTNIQTNKLLRQQTFVPKANVKIFKSAKVVNLNQQYANTIKNEIASKNRTSGNSNKNKKNIRMTSSAANIALVIGLTVIHDAVRGDVSIETLQKAGINTAYVVGSDILFATLASQSDNILKTSLKYSGKNTRHVAKLLKTGSKIAGKSLPFVMDAVFIVKSIYDYNKGNISQNEMLGEIGMISLTTTCVLVGCCFPPYGPIIGIAVGGIADLTYILFMEKKAKERIMNEMKWLAEKEQISNDEYIKSLKETLRSNSVNEENEAWMLLLQWQYY